MKIILLEDVKKQGKKGDIITVADGYGNFLIKAHQAVLASSGGVERLNKEKAKAKQDEENLIKECEKIKNELEKTSITFKVKTGKDGKVFGSISSKQISEELSKKGYKIDKKKINIKDQINTLGTTLVNISLHSKVIASVKINLIKE